MSGFRSLQHDPTRRPVSVTARCVRNGDECDCCQEHFNMCDQQMKEEMATEESEDEKCAA